MKVTYTTAVGYSVATSSLESPPTDGEKSNQRKKLLFLKCDYGSISVKHSAEEVILHFSTQQKWYS